jgi:Na+(H+)/acetate symporter ActP
MLKYNPSPAREHERERDNILLLPTLAWGGRIRKFPLLLLSPFWRGFNTTGAIARLTTGLLASIALIWRD